MITLIPVDVKNCSPRVRRDVDEAVVCAGRIHFDRSEVKSGGPRAACRVGKKVKTCALWTLGLGALFLLFGIVGGIERGSCEMGGGMMISGLCLVVMTVCGILLSLGNSPLE